MWFYAVDVAVAAAATVLIASGLIKVAQPAPITATLLSLWNKSTGRIRESAPLFLGVALGFGETGLAVWMVMGRSEMAGMAVAAFGAGIAAAGLIGARSGGDLPCACFGGHSRTLGHLHVLQFPLWLAAAWCTAQAPKLVEDFGPRVTMLGACVAVVAGIFVTRMWIGLLPVTRRRLRQALAPAVALSDSPRPRDGGLRW